MKMYTGDGYMNNKQLEILSIICIFGWIPTIFISDILATIIGICGIICIAYYAYNKKEQKSNEYKAKLELLNNLLSEEEYNWTNKLYDIDNNSLLALDTTNKVISFIECKKLKQGFTAKKKTFGYDHILESHIVENGSTVINTSRLAQASGAMIGGLVAGGVGAVVGGLSSGQSIDQEVRSLELVLVLNNLENPVHRIKLLTLDKDIYPIKKSDDRYVNAKEKAEYWQHLIKVIHSQIK